MPRTARTKSETGIYHIMLRGINRKSIFEDTEDCERFLATLEKYKKICGYEIYAYCLMVNHIHILLKVGDEDVDLIMKRLAGSFVFWYNNKYDRVGHLFQDRFRSEPVEDDQYFLTVLRYIHQNPVKAKMVSKPGEYVFSSYMNYINGDRRLVDIDFALSMIKKDEFIRFNNTDNEDVCLDADDSAARLNDKACAEIFFDVTGCKSPHEFLQFDILKRDSCIKQLKERGLSLRQITRLTGITFGLARRIN